MPTKEKESSNTARFSGDRRRRCLFCLPSCCYPPLVLESDDLDDAGKDPPPLPQAAHRRSTLYFFACPNNTSRQKQTKTMPMACSGELGGVNISTAKMKKTKTKKKDRKEKIINWRSFFYKLKKIIFRSHLSDKFGVATGHVDLLAPYEEPALNDEVAEASRPRHRHIATWHSDDLHLPTKTAAAADVSKSRTTSRTSSRKQVGKPPPPFAKANKFDRAIWLSVPAATLAAVIFSGKAAAVTHLVLFLYVLFYLRKLRASRDRATAAAVADKVAVFPTSPAVAMGSEKESSLEEKKTKVVMEGFLERKKHIGRTTAMSFA